MNNTFCKIAMQKIADMFPFAGGWVEAPGEIVKHILKTQPDMIDKYLSHMAKKDGGFISDFLSKIDESKLPAIKGEHGLAVRGNSEHGFLETANKKAKKLLGITDTAGKKGTFLPELAAKASKAAPEATEVISHSAPEVAETAAKVGGKKGKILAGLAGLLGIGGAGAAGAYHTMSEKSTIDALKELAHEHPWHAAGAGAAAAGAAGGSAVGIKKLLGKAKKAKSKPAAKGLAKLKELLKAVKR